MNNTTIMIALKSWENEQIRFNKVLDKISDEQLLQEIAPTKNTGIYLLGHCAAVTDAMMPLLGLGQKQYPDAEKIFITTADKSGQQIPTTAEVKEMFAKVNTAFSEAIKNMPAE
jgi:DinB superfamily